MASDEFLLPIDTAAFGPSMRTSEGFRLNPDLKNLYLAFYRLVPKDLNSHKSAYLRALVKHWNGDGPWNEDAKALAERQQAQIDALKQQGWETEALELQTAGRFIAGLGYENALEVGMTLHPLYGVPYLPGTAVKGVTRAWAEDVEDIDEECALTVFGSRTKDEKADDEKRLEAVRFFDALPLEFPELEVDVMTPHYSDYYRENEPPGDWQDPNPISFLTVAAGVTFRFALASRDVDALDSAHQWLRSGLRDLGIGGKTSAGYGFFWSEEEHRKIEQTLGERAGKPREKERKSATEAEWLDDVGRNAGDIPAEVVDNSRRPLKVKIFVRAYEDEVFDCGGLRNIEASPPGTRFYVRVGTYSTNRGLIDVTFHHR